MTSSRIRVLLLLFLALPMLAVMGGCSSFPKASLSLQRSVESNAALIQAQQELLNLQNVQLQNMSDHQLAIAGTLENMQNQLTRLQQEMARAQQKARNSKKENTTKKSETVSGRKASVQSTAPTDGKMIVGRNEWVWLDLLDQVFNARIDTGNRTSAINAREIQPFERNGERWVRFQLAEDDGSRSWEAPLTRYVKVRNAAEELDRRPVIELTVRLGSFVEQAEFTLADSSAMPYPVQLGRDFLRDIALVDVAKKFTQPKPDSQTVAR